MPAHNTHGEECANGGLAVERREALEEYRAKRVFTVSPEPPGDSRARGGALPVFVVQKHQATRLHYDFRLEAEGVLKSWAVPKGPSMDPRVKRLAVQVEDHPLDYADFEGVIPEGYGAGTVMVWDGGTFRNLRDIPLAAAIAGGHVSVELNGRKLRGGYGLVRLDDGEGKNWLLVKAADAWADAGRDPVRDEPRSVKTGRTMEEIREEGVTTCQLPQCKGVGNRAVAPVRSGRESDPQ